MGWYYQPRGRDPIDPIRETERMLTSTVDQSRVPLASYYDGSAVYTALRVRRDNIDYTICVLTLIDIRAMDWGYKPQDECMGPVAAGCPTEILDLLSPVDDLPYPQPMREYARNWRSRARKNNPLSILR